LRYRTDARGVLTTYGYDSLNRLHTVGYNVGTSGVPTTLAVRGGSGLFRMAESIAKIAAIPLGPES
jgi:hypothetical protein